jgi:hypothetical protein
LPEANDPPSSGEFPTADDETVIPLELVMSAVGRQVSSLSYYPTVPKMGFLGRQQIVPVAVAPLAGNRDYLDQA